MSCSLLLFLLSSIQALLHTSLDQRLIYWNPINFTLDDGKWILFLLHYLWNRPLWINLKISPTIYNIVFSENVVWCPPYRCIFKAQRSVFLKWAGEMEVGRTRDNGLYLSPKSECLAEEDTEGHSEQLCSSLLIPRLRHWQRHPAAFPICMILSALLIKLWFLSGC